MLRMHRETRWVHAYVGERVNGMSVVGLSVVGAAVVGDAVLGTTALNYTDRTDRSTLLAR
jgi:hypothetical protein